MNERIKLLKAGLSDIVKRYSYQTVQDFYQTYHTARSCYMDYREKVAKWEEKSGEHVRQETLDERIQR